MPVKALFNGFFISRCLGWLGWNQWFLLVDTADYGNRGICKTFNPGKESPQ